MALKTLWTLMGCVACISAEASILDMSASTLDLTGTNTSSTSYSTALSVRANTGGDILVIGTFSTEASAKIGSGEWQLESGGNTSQAISRSLVGKNDKGVASVAHIFTGVQNNDFINLQHKTSAGNTLNTFGGNLIAIPLSVSTGEKLNHTLRQQTGSFQTGSTAWVTTSPTTTKLQLDRASDNGFYLAATFNVQALDGAETGCWKLQYRKVGDATWNETGSQMDRTMSDANDVGAVTLYALEEGLPPGEYEIQVLAKSATGTIVETLSGTLAAVALSYTNAVGGGYFDGFSTTATDLNPVGGPYNGAQDSLTLDVEGDIFSSMSFNSSALKGVNNTGAFDLLLTNSTSSIKNQLNQRYFDDGGDAGSAASAGLFEDLAAETHSIFGHLENVAGQIDSSNVTLVGFSATATIPEPAVVSLVILFGGGLLLSRRLLAP